MAIEHWDTAECINWAQNDEPLWTECDRLAKKYKAHPAQARLHIHQAIVASGILRGTGINQKKVDWQAVAEVFLESIE